MKFRPLLNIIGALLSILGTSMIVPIFISMGYGEPDMHGFIISMLTCVTLGLPFLRVSPDHGPNQKMIGKNKSNPQSLIEAVKFLNKFK